MNAADGTTVLDSLIAAVNRHDLDALVGHFADDVRSDTPAHPARSFIGREQVRRNWSQILGSIEDLRATIVASAVSGGGAGTKQTVWAELAFDGRRVDGAPWRMRGVTVNEVAGDRIVALRFYMEPLEETGPDADASVRQVTGPVATVAGR